MEFHRDSSRTWATRLVASWPTHRNRAFFQVPELRERCKQVLTDLCEVRGWTVADLQIYASWVKIELEIWPSNSPVEVVRYLKRKSASELNKVPAINQAPAVWTRSYLVWTLGAPLPADVLQTYLAQQGLLNIPEMGGG